MINIKVIKWMVVSGDKFLSNNGFRSFSSPTACPKLFTGEEQARKYMNKPRYALMDKLEFVEVEVNVKEKEVATYEN